MPKINPQDLDEYNELPEDLLVPKPKPKKLRLSRHTPEGTSRQIQTKINRRQERQNQILQRESTND